MSNVMTPYEALFADQLVPAARVLQDYILSVLHGELRIDIVSARAKSPERFAAKAAKINDDGKLRYDDPRFQIQDQIGARINVFYLDDVLRISSLIREEFPIIESSKKEPESNSEFSYFGQHFILKIPEEAIPEDPDVTFPKFFELQIKTLFQHAWSEAHHDLGYKSIKELSAEDRRKIAFSSAQAWGADQEFHRLARELVPDYQSNNSRSDVLSSR